MDELLKENNLEEVINEYEAVEERANETAVPNLENSIILNEEPEQKSKKKTNPKTKKTVAICISAIVLISIIAVPIYMNATFFERLTSDFLDEYPFADNSRSQDGSYLKIDTNPDDVDRNTLAYYEYDLFYKKHSDSLSAIQYVNKKLGFSDSVYDDMSNTTSMMGRREAANKKFKVSWTYHPDKGLEVKYEKNK